jgi:hypothetical protein
VLPSCSDGFRDCPETDIIGRMDDYGPLLGVSEWPFIAAVVLAIVTTAVVASVLLLQQRRRDRVDDADRGAAAGLSGRLAELESARSEGRLSEDEYGALRAQLLDLR